MATILLRRTQNIDSSAVVNSVLKTIEVDYAVHHDNLFLVLALRLEHRHLIEIGLYDDVETVGLEIRCIFI